MSKSTIALNQTLNSSYEQVTTEESQQIDEALDREFALVEEQQNYYHFAYYECDRI